LAWTISYTGSALKQLHKLDRPTAQRLIDFLDQRIAPLTDPRSQGQALHGPTLATLWRYRVGDYRVVCEIQDGALLILVIQIGHRKGVYR